MTNIEKLRVESLKILFTRVNEDCAASGQDVVPFDDVEYYQIQIMNLCGDSSERAWELASKLKES